MSRRSGIHMRTGDRVAAGDVDAWCARHQIELTTADDAFSGLGALLSEAVPFDWIWIGLDWLAPDEVAVVRYARQRCPSAAIVVYGAAQIAVAPDMLRGVLWCADRESLREALLTEPTALAGRSRSSGSSLWRPMGGRAAVRPASGEDRGAPPERGNLRDSARRRPSSGFPLITDAAPPRAALTAEELEALSDIQEL